MFISETIPNRPTGKLLFASALLIFALTAVLFDKVEQAGMPFWAAALIINLYSLFVSYAVFTLPTFQALVGLMVLITGFLGGLRIWGGLIGLLLWDRSIGEFSDTVWLHCITLWCLVVGYFLLIDKEVAEYRSQLSLHFPAKNLLDPKVDNLPDDPINPS